MRKKIMNKAATCLLSSFMVLTGSAAVITGIPSVSSLAVTQTVYAADNRVPWLKVPWMKVPWLRRRKALLRALLLLKGLLREKPSRRPMLQRLGFPPVRKVLLRPLTGRRPRWPSTGWATVIRGL